jgi:hypothetical protein
VKTGVLPQKFCRRREELFVREINPNGETNLIFSCQRSASQAAHNAPSDPGIGEIITTVQAGAPTAYCPHPFNPWASRRAATLRFRGRCVLTSDSVLPTPLSPFPMGERGGSRTRKQSCLQIRARNRRGCTRCGLCGKKETSLHSLSSFEVRLIRLTES